VVDDKGEQTTVTRTVDGQTVKQTTIQKKNGEKETIEDLINMDESKYERGMVLDLASNTGSFFDIFF